MKKVFTTVLLSMFCYCAFAQLSIWYNGRVVYQRDYAEIDSVTFGLPTGTTPAEPSNPGEGTVFTAEQTKNYLMDVAKQMVEIFNTDDQKVAINLAENMYVKYKEYSWDEVGDYFDDRYDELWEVPRYVKGVANGKRAPMATHSGYTFSFAGEAAIFEADDANQKWVYKGKSSDNSVILRCYDNKGALVEAKFWAEGTTTTHEYTWEDFHYECPKIYAEDEGVVISQISGYYNGDYHTFYHDETAGGWYYIIDGYYDYDNDTWVDEQRVNIQLEAAAIYSYCENYCYAYDATTGKFYRNDWENEYRVYEGNTHTVTAILPAKMCFALKQGSTEISRFTVQQDFEENDHANFSIDAKFANLSWTTDLNVTMTSTSFAFAMYYGSQLFFSGAANAPSYELIARGANEKYEDWADRYVDRYDELLKKIGPADGVFDLFGKVQIKAKTDNWSYAYRDWMAWEDDYDGRFRTKESVKKFCSIFNDNATNGLYYNSDVKQAELKVITSYDEIEETYSPEPVLYFPEDGTSYGFEQYFNRKPFTDLEYMVEDLVNDYIRMSKSLYDAVGTVSFH